MVHSYARLSSTVSEEKKWLLKHVPFYASWYRFSLIWRYSDRLLASVRRDPEWTHPERSMNARNDWHRKFLTDFIREELEERTDTFDKDLPDYAPYGKRVLVDNDWFKTLKRGNVELITESIAQITNRSVVTETGAEYGADIIVFATGFHASQPLGSVEVSVKVGRSLNEIWGDDDPSKFVPWAWREHHFHRGMPSAIYSGTRYAHPGGEEKHG